MSPDPASLALNLLAFVGAGAYALTQAGMRERSALDVRLAYLLTLLMTLVGVRALRWEFPLVVLNRIEEALAALLPLFALTVAEGLMRRHAPSWLKLAIVVGALLFAFAALMRPDAASRPFAILLGAFVALSLVSLALLLALRDARSLAPAENDAIAALSVGLVIAVPLAVTDFLAGAGIAPIRAGGLGLLVFVFAAARVTASGGNGFDVLGDLVWAALAALAGFIALWIVMGWPDLVEGLRWYGAVSALVLVILIAERMRMQRRARKRASLWRAFAEAPADDLDAFLNRMLAAPELERAELLGPADLADYDEDGLARALAPAGVLSAAHVSGRTDPSYEQLAVVLDAHQATHAVLVSRTPLRLLLVNLPRVGAGAETDLQLRVLSKLAQQAGAHA